MKASELRIGNFVKSPVNNRRRIKVLQLFVDSFQGDFGDGSRGGIMYSSSEGITLTEEWLLNFGFKIHWEDSISIEYWIGHNPVTRDYLFMLYQTKGEQNEIFYRNGFFRLQYVHQLQNLYFALTGKELELK